MMTNLDDKNWMAVFYSYDEHSHCAVSIERCEGPYSFKQAWQIECDYDGEGYVQMAEWKEEV